METKKVKCKNFTAKEKAHLIELVKKYKSVLENKATNASTIIAKNKTWNAITLEFNTLIESRGRSANQLKNLYKNLKHQTRKKIAKENRTKYMRLENELETLKKERASDKNEISKTGGGTFEHQLTETGARILTLMGEQITPLQNPHDDGAIYRDDVAPVSSPKPIFEEVEIMLKTEPAPDLFDPSDIFNESTPVDVFSTPITSPIKRCIPLTKRRKLTTTSGYIKKKYFLTKLKLAQFQLRSSKIQHNLDMKIKMEQLKYYKTKNNVNTELQ